MDVCNSVKTASMIFVWSANQGLHLQAFMLDIFLSCGIFAWHLELPEVPQNVKTGISESLSFDF
jgi:hypothetical protein